MSDGAKAYTEKGMVMAARDLELVCAGLRSGIAPHGGGSYTDVTVIGNLLATVDARDEEVRRLTKALDEASAYLANVSGALVDASTIKVGTEETYVDGVRALTAERDVEHAARLHAEKVLAETGAKYLAETVKVAGHVELLREALDFAHTARGHGFNPEWCTRLIAKLTAALAPTGEGHEVGCATRAGAFLNYAPCDCGKSGRGDSIRSNVPVPPGEGPVTHVEGCRTAGGADPQPLPPLSTSSSPREKCSMCEGMRVDIRVPLYLRAGSVCPKCDNTGLEPVPGEEK